MSEWEEESVTDPRRREADAASDHILRVWNGVGEPPDFGYRIRQPAISESVVDSSGGRGTGHFGTGVYFLGQPDNRDLTPRESVYHFEIPREAKLYRPRDHDSAHELHRGLQWVNRAVHAETYQPHFGPPLDTEAQLARAHGHLTGGLHFNHWDDAKEYMPAAVRFARDQLAELQANADLRFKNPKLYYGMAAESPSGSTRLMQMLGYDGIDVRHLPSLDNTEYGSVIYSPYAEKVIQTAVPHFPNPPKEGTAAPRVSERDRKWATEIMGMFLRVPRRDWPEYLAHLRAVHPREEIVGDDEQEQFKVGDWLHYSKDNEPGDPEGSIFGPALVTDITPHKFRVARADGTPWDHFNGWFDRAEEAMWRKHAPETLQWAQQPPTRES
jgi:hypothetical protein